MPKSTGNVKIKCVVDENVKHDVIYNVNNEQSVGVTKYKKIDPTT